MRRLTGLSSTDINDLVRAIADLPNHKAASPWPPALGLLDALNAALIYLRRNHAKPISLTS